MAERNGIEIDYCPECRGIWLDRGELDKIIERSSSSSAKDFESDDYSKKKPYYGDDRDYEKKKKRESFLGDLFDF